MLLLVILLSYVILLISLLLSVPFIVLLERKVLGLVQSRKGPNKVGVFGYFQSFSDALKLLMKMFSFPFNSNVIMFYFFPFFSLWLFVSVWVCLPSGLNLLNLFWGGLLIFCFLGLNLYSLIGMGWSSNSSYSLLGFMRGISQSISYEICMFLIFLNLIFYINSYMLLLFSLNQYMVMMIYLYFLIFFLWFVCVLAETNRTPFDFSEGESELVSGFNIDFLGGGFAMIFMGEYLGIMFMSFMMSVVYFGGLSLNIMLFLGSMILYLILLIRGVLPRYRYDKLMYNCWKIYLPVSLMMMFLYSYSYWLLMFKFKKWLFYFK